MQFNLDNSIAILERTPSVLSALLQGLPDAWTSCNEGADTWSAYDIVGHLIHGEETDWLPRVRIILEHGETRPFDPFDRFAQFENSKGKSMDELLDSFAELRAVNLAELLALDLREEQFGLRGTHPALGTVTLANLLSVWPTHDLGHIYQISRIMAGQYKHEVGPWPQYLRVLQESSL